MSFGKLAALWFGLMAMVAIGDLIIMRSLLSPSAPGELHQTEVAGGRLVLPQTDGNGRAVNGDQPPPPEPPSTAETPPSADVAPLSGETQVAGSPQEQPVPTTPPPAASSSPTPRPGVSFVPGQPMVDTNPSR
ncbi:MAG TPA: hypothetical protein VK980_17695 [Sphingomonas sp.]|nr:hypothetical protein [Sphingomonas sp.]